MLCPAPTRRPGRRAHRRGLHLQQRAKQEQGQRTGQLSESRAADGEGLDPPVPGRAWGLATGSSSLELKPLAPPRPPLALRVTAIP